MTDLASVAALAAQQSDLPNPDAAIAAVLKFCEKEELSISDLGLFVQHGELVDRWARRLPLSDWASTADTELGHIKIFITHLATLARSELECGVDSVVRAARKRLRERSPSPAQSQPTCPVPHHHSIARPPGKQESCVVGKRP